MFASVLSAGALLVGFGVGMSLYSLAWRMLNKDLAAQYTAV